MIINMDQVEESTGFNQLIPRPEGFICTIGKPEVKEFQVTNKDDPTQKAIAVAMSVKLTADTGDGYGIAKWFFNHPFSADATRIGWERTKGMLGACKLPNTGQFDTANIEWIQGKKVHATFKYGRPFKDDNGNEVKLVELSWCQPVEKAPPEAKVSSVKKDANPSPTTNQSGGQQVKPIESVSSVETQQVSNAGNPPPIESVQSDSIEPNDDELDEQYGDEIPF